MSIMLILVIMLLCIVPSHLIHFVKQSFLYVMLSSVAQLTANQSIKFLVCDYTFGEDATEAEGWGLKTTLTRDSRFVEAVFVIDDLLDVVDVEVVERFFDRGDIHSALGEVGDQADFGLDRGLGLSL
jgi:hypothetical protein